jgi:hypothetical protein
VLTRKLGQGIDEIQKNIWISNEEGLEDIVVVKWK